MKRLIFGGFSALLVLTATTPVWASSKGATQHNDMCDSIPSAQPTGGATLQRLEAIKWCEQQPQSVESSSVDNSLTKQLDSSAAVQPQPAGSQDLTTIQSLTPGQRRIWLQMRRSEFGGH